MLKIMMAADVPTYAKIYLKNAFSARGQRVVYSMGRTITGLWAFRPGKKVRLKPDDYVYVIVKDYGKKSGNKI